MPNVYALAANPLVQQLAQEEVKTKGARAVFGVILMFLILCGGVWMLLQSSFGPWQAYLISSIAFWGSWLVLATIWLTGVPGIPALGIPRSTPQWYGPQGAERSWVVVHPFGEDKELVEAFDRFAERNESAFFKIDESLKDANTQTQRSAAESAANALVSEEYARELGVGASDITTPDVIKITEVSLGKDGGEFKYARVTYGPAEVNQTTTEPKKELIGRIKPKTIELALHSGSLSEPTYWSLLLFTVLFVGHTALLVRYEQKHVDQPAGSPERIAAAV